KMHHLRVAVSETPEGPYQDTGTCLTNPFTCPFAIDASPFQDDDGSWYLFYARDFLDTDRPGTALVVDKLASMTRLAGDQHLVLRAGQEWQRFMVDRIIYGGRYDWHTLEGPCVRKRNGRYFCFFSSGRWENDTYGVDFATADHAGGPYTSSSESTGPRVLRTIPGRLVGPGHNSIVSVGDTDYIVYHAWDSGMTGRRMFLDAIDWTSGEPVVTTK
ncbi:MAG: family 43 glycosylhydrolase, partial [Bryobacteraceae bacterium]